MKNLFFLPVFCLLLSCSPRFQVVTTVPSSKSITDTSLVFEYDFWSPGGQMFFVVRNKTERIITVHLDKSFVVINGFSTCYYTGEALSQGTSQSGSFAIPIYTRPFYSVGENNKVNSNQKYIGSYEAGSQQFSSVTTQQQRTIQIAPLSAVQIHRFGIVNENKIFFSDSLKVMVKQKKPSSVRFSEKNTPLTIASVVSYSIDGDEKAKTLNHGFFVNNITNYHRKDFITRSSLSPYGEFFSFYFKYKPDEVTIQDWP